jgi:hypothetical protein
MQLTVQLLSREEQQVTGAMSAANPFPDMMLQAEALP